MELGLLAGVGGGERMQGPGGESVPRAEKARRRLEWLEEDAEERTCGST